MAFPRDDALDALRRSLYWSQGAGMHEPATTQQVRNKLLESIAHLRDDERRYIPYDEPMLSGSTTFRRRVKRYLFKTFRYATWRYDRLLREQAALTVSLADRVIALEAELAALRDRVDPPEDPA
ncbi:MAG TPA: hypothetical protein VE032_03215 [Actinomycetota bacterium]|nr:hypothetical protein [Actinomycetota bacterium]